MTSIPYSLALRIVPNCTEPEVRDRRLEELKMLLLARDYKLNIINECIRKARAIPRSEALKDVVKEIGTPWPVFVVLFDPRMPSIAKIVNWRTMVSNDPYLREVFPAHKCMKNLRGCPVCYFVLEVRMRLQRLTLWWRSRGT